MHWYSANVTLLPLHTITLYTNHVTTNNLAFIIVFITTMWHINLHFISEMKLMMRNKVNKYPTISCIIIYMLTGVYIFSHDLILISYILHHFLIYLCTFKFLYNINEIPVTYPGYMVVKNKVYTILRSLRN